MNNYDVWLLDGLNNTKLDTEDLAIATTFSVAEMADISKRKDAIALTVLIKGTKTNNIAFGSMFFANKTTSFDVADLIGFNYNSLRPVDCWVYENNALILRGSLRIMGIQVTKNGEVFYDTAITGKFFDFATTTKDKKLTDLDFSDLSHTYLLENMMKSWGSPTFRGTTHFYGSDGRIELNGDITAIAPYINYPGMQFKISGSLHNDRIFTIVSIFDETEFTDVILDVAETVISEDALATFTVNPSFQTGKGFVYPYIDYGVLFKKASSNFADYEVSADSTPPGNYFDPTKFNVLNFKPAVYVREYVDRIFKQLNWVQNVNSDLGLPIPGDYDRSITSLYTYEILGDDDFQAKFNSLIIPYAGDNTIPIIGQISKFTSTTAEVSNASQTNYGLPGPEGNINGRQLISFDTFIPPSISHYVDFFSPYNDVISVLRTFTADVGITVTMHVTSTNGWPINLKLQLVQRPASTGHNAKDSDRWVMVAESQPVVIVSGAPSTPYTFTFTPGIKTYEQGQQLALRLWWGGQYSSVGDIGIAFTVNTAEFDLPKNNTTTFSLDYNYDSSDTIVPAAPENISQMDFLKSLLNLFNIYVFSKTGKEYHLYFQKYDDYYVQTNNDIIATDGSHHSIREFAINWTGKIDYSNGYKITTNATIPKSYTFTYKDDADYANDDYKKAFGQTYGTFNLPDKLGIGDVKTVSLIFSPTPLLSYAGTGRIFPGLYAGLPDTTRTPLKTNIRILHYNGLQPCLAWWASDENFTGIADLQTFSYYPNCSTYYTGSTPYTDLNFGRPKKWYFPASPDFINATTAYTQFYINQITELTNPNIFQLDANVYLNEIDINQMDLRTPVFVDMGNKGQVYLKILSVNYENYFTPATVVFQKIYLTVGDVLPFIEFFTISLNGHAVKLIGTDPPSTLSTDGYLITAHSGADIYCAFYLPYTYDVSRPLFTDWHIVPSGLTINSAGPVDDGVHGYQWYVIMHYPATTTTPFNFITI